jgi:hypothetical protein
VAINVPGSAGFFVSGLTQKQQPVKVVDVVWRADVMIVSGQNRTA